MKKDFKITKNEMIDALNRSGYLLESEISRTLANEGYFIESNQVIEDPITGKSREIDLLAEYYGGYKKEWADFKTATMVKFVFEIKNNLFPFVLLTRFEFSPNIEDWKGLKEALTLPKNLNYDWHESFYEEIINKKNTFIYTQYCSFHKKKANDELMALHPDNIHEGLSKITHYCEEMVKLHDKCLLYEDSEESIKKDEFFRHFLFMPILLIKEELYELRDEKLIKVESSILVHNYHFNKEPKMAYVFIVTKNGFPEFIKKMRKLEETVKLKMIETRKKLT
jgi:hypothetical protein